MPLEPTTAQLHALWNLPPSVSNSVLDFLGDMADSNLQPEDATVILVALEKVLFQTWNVRVPVANIARGARP